VTINIFLPLLRPVARRYLVATLATCVWSADAARAAERVDTALVLTIDVSASIDHERYDLQQQGFAAAFANQAVIDAVEGGENKAIAVTLVEWSGLTSQKQVIGWTLIKDAASANAFSLAARAAPRAFSDFTSISAALDFCTALVRSSGYDAFRLVIGVSGDGSNNSGASVIEARDAAIAAGATINGLPILAVEPNLEGYYRENVIGGEGSFVEVAEEFPSFANAILNKLVREIAGDPVPSFELASTGERGGNEYAMDPTRSAPSSSSVDVARDERR
jgi:hypothetical protein